MENKNETPVLDQVAVEELSILEVEDRLAFASSARCDSKAS